MMEKEEVAGSSVSQPNASGRGLWSKIRGLMLVVSVFGLGSLNVLTLMNDQIHSFGFNVLKSVMSSFLPDHAVASITRKSSVVRRQADVAIATKNLVEEQARLIAQNKSLDIRYAELLRANKDITNKHDELKRVAQLRAATAKRVGTRLALRTTRGATRSSTSAAAKAIPWVGAAIVVGGVAWDLYDACETIKDVNELNGLFGNDLEDQSTVCGMKVPTKDEVLAKAKTNWQAAYKAAADSMNSAEKNVISIAPPIVSWADLKGSVCPVLGTVPMLCP